MYENVKKDTLLPFLLLCMYNRKCANFIIDVFSILYVFVLFSLGWTVVCQRKSANVICPMTSNSCDNDCRVSYCMFLFHIFAKTSLTILDMDYIYYGRYSLVVLLSIVILCIHLYLIHKTIKLSESMRNNSKIMWNILNCVVVVLQYL